MCWTLIFHKNRFDKLLGHVLPQPRMFQPRRKKQKHSSTWRTHLYLSAHPFHSNNTFHTLWYFSCWLPSYFHYLCFDPKLLCGLVLNFNSLASMKVQIISCQWGCDGARYWKQTNAALTLQCCCLGAHLEKVGTWPAAVVVDWKCSCLKHF